MLQDGRIYRTQEAHDRLQAIFARLGNPELALKSLRKKHAASIMAKEKNAWKPTPASLPPDIQKACVEHGHSGLWDSMDYDIREVDSTDMKACYPASYKGMVKQTLFRAVRTFKPPYDPRANQWGSPQRHWYWVC